MPPAVRRDEPFPLRVSGVAPASPVRVTVSLPDLAGGTWTATTTVRADGRGVATLQPGPADPPGVQGLVQRLTPPAPGTAPAFPPVVDLTVRASDGVDTVVGRVTRRTVPPEVTVRTPGRGLAGRYYEPAGEPRGAVLALHGSGGRPTDAVAGALSARGVAVLAQRYFGPDVPDAPDGLREVPLWLFDRAVDRLRARTGLETVGVLGVSRGTEAATLTAARRSDVEALVCLSPSAFVTHALAGDPDAAAWTDADGPLAYLPPDPDRDQDRPRDGDDDGDGEGEAGADTGPRPRYRPGYERAVAAATEAELDAAALPTDAVDAPVTLVSGTGDAVWPATPWAERLVAALEARPDGPPVTHHRYRGAGHDLHVPFRPTATRVGSSGMALGGTAAATARAEADAWPRVRAALGAGD